MPKEFTLRELASIVGGECHGDGSTILNKIEPLQYASPSSLTLIDNNYYLNYLKSTQAGAVVLTRQFLRSCPTNALVVSNPMLAMLKLEALFEPLSVHSDRQSLIAGSARIHSTAKLGKNVFVGENVVIEQGVSLGDEVCIEANATIKKDSIIGAGTHIDSGTVIGSKPFNPLKNRGRWLAGLASGKVLIGNDVNIGANCCIDRGSLADTIIGNGVHIDNLVQIGHDVIIGDHAVVAGCAAIGAHTELGAHCAIGGGTCVAGMLTIEEGVVVTGMSGVNKSLTKEGIYSSGTTVSEHTQWRKNAARFKRLDDYVVRLKRLEECLRESE